MLNLAPPSLAVAMNSARLQEVTVQALQLSNGLRERKWAYNSGPGHKVSAGGSKAQEGGFSKSQYVQEKAQNTVSTKPTKQLSKKEMDE